MSGFARRVIEAPRLTLESLLRLSEALHLRRDDLGPTYATIVQSKSGQSRQVPLTPVDEKLSATARLERVQMSSASIAWLRTARRVGGPS
jgi:integrase